jgi:O-antigen ligase
MSQLRAAGPWPALLTVFFGLAGLLVGLVAAVQGASDAAYDGAIAVMLLPVLAGIVVLVEPSITLTAGLGLSMFSGNWGQVQVPIALDRVMLFAGVAGIALRAIGDPRYRPRLRPVHGVLALAALYAVGSALVAGTLDDHAAVFALLDRYGLISFLLFLVAPVAFATDRQRSHLLIGLVAMGAYLGVIAFLQEVNLDQLVFPSYITDPNVGIHANRARGPFVEAAANGLAMFACAVAAAMAVARWRGRARELAIGVAILCLAGIIFTVTRQAWLGAAIGSLVALGAAPRLRAYAVPLVAGGVLLVLVSFAVIPGLQERAGSRANDQLPVWDRLNSDRAGLAMVAARPVLGFGWARFAAESEPYYKQAATYPLTQVGQLHSVFLSNAVELGIVGAVIWAAGLFMAVGGAILRRGPPELEPWRLGLLAFAVCWLVVSNFTPLGYTFSNYLLWVWAGLVGGAALPPRGSGP